MPRPERPIDPAAGPVQSLAADLRQLRRQAGTPAYRRLAERAGYSSAALASAASGQQLPSLAVTLAFVRACDGDAPAWQRRWQQAAAELAARRPPCSDEPTGESPYLGLTRYEVTDADRFFGRAASIARVVELLARRRFVAVFGVSGSGKSSLLRAGVIPALRRAGRRPVLVTPGAEPAVALRKALDEAGTDECLLVVVDQFEELFTLCPDDGERDAFVTALAALAADGTDTRVVVGVRADFYAQCIQQPVLTGLLTGADLPVGPMTAAELSDVVVESARRVGLSAERALVTKVLADAAGQPGALPLVSHALRETYRQRRGDVLTVAGYEAAGGLTGAIAQTAEQVYDRLDAGQRDTLREVLVRLVTLGADGVQDTRRRVRRDELAFPDADLVLDRLAAARLVVLDQETVEVAHEALITAWPRLHDWLHADRDTLRAHRQLTEACQLWYEHGHDADTLYRGARLSAWDGRTLHRLNDRERAFLAESRARRARAEQVRRRRRRLTMSGLSAGMVVLTVLSVTAFAQAGRADAQRDLALSRQLVADARAQAQSDQELAVMLAARAYDTRPTEDSGTALRQAVVDSRVRAVLPSGQGQVFGVAYSPDGRRLAGSGADGTVRVWQRDAPGQDWRQVRTLPGHQGNVWSPVFSPDGRWLAACGVDGTVSVWDLDGGAGPVLLRGHEGVVVNVAFNADGTRVAAAGEDGTVRIWDRGGAEPARVLRVGERALGVAFSPDGRYLAATGEGPVRLWDASGSGEPRLLAGHEGAVENIAFSPDSQRVVSGGVDGTVRIWSVASGTASLVLRGPYGKAESVAFSPDGRRVVCGYSGSNTVVVWGATSDQDPLVMRGHRGTVWSAGFSPDGREAASASSDGTVRVWDAGYAGNPSIRYGHDGAAWSVAASADGRRVVSGGEDGTVRVWSTADGEPIVLRGHQGDVLDVAVSADGGRVVSGGRDRTVRVWNPAAGTSTVLTGHTGSVLSVALSPDGRRVASASSDGTVRVWNSTGEGMPVVLSGHQTPARAVAFSPDGRRVASGDGAGLVRVWSADGTGTPVVLRGHPPELAWTVAFSPDGRRVASGGQDGSLRIWSVDGRGQPVVLRGHSGAVWSVAFTPDGQRLVSAGAEGGIRLWQADTGRPLLVVQGNGASTEDVAVTADGRRLVTAHGDGTVRVWRDEVYPPVGQLRAEADQRVTRALTAEERRTFSLDR